MNQLGKQSRSVHLCCLLKVSSEDDDVRDISLPAMNLSTAGIISTPKSAQGDSASRQAGQEAAGEHEPSGSDDGDAMSTLGGLFDAGQELPADALVFTAADADYEQKDWGWGDATDSLAEVQQPEQENKQQEASKTGSDLLQPLSSDSHAM